MGPQRGLSFSHHGDGLYTVPRACKTMNTTASGLEGSREEPSNPRLAKSGAFRRLRGKKTGGQRHWVEIAGNGEDGGESQLGSTCTIERHNYFRNGTHVTEMARGCWFLTPASSSFHCLLIDAKSTFFSP